MTLAPAPTHTNSPVSLAAKILLAIPTAPVESRNVPPICTYPLALSPGALATCSRYSGSVLPIPTRLFVGSKTKLSAPWNLPSDAFLNCIELLASEASV